MGKIYHLKAYLGILEITVFLFENFQAFSQGAEMYTYRNTQANSGKTVILTKYGLEKI